MLTIEKLSRDDIAELKQMPKGRKLYFVLFGLGVCASFLFGLLGLLKNAPGYWPVTLASISFFSLALIILLIKESFLYRKDLARQEKISGLVQVAEKSKTKDGSFFIFNDPLLKKFNMFSETAFDRVQEGDTLMIELTRYSKYLLKLEHEGDDLIKLNR